MSSETGGEAPSQLVAEAVARAGGSIPIEWHRSRGGGYTPAERWLVRFDDGRRAFAKVGVTPLVATWLGRELRAYREITGPFMPTLLGWADSPIPTLLLEDLSDAQWPPPWDRRLVDLTLEALQAVASTPPPRWAKPIRDLKDIFSGWTTIATDPRPFLGLRIASERWLHAALPTLIAHERPPELAGEALLHFDVRSDNLCFVDGRSVLVDWNLVARGNALFDVAAWLPSLAAEGGPPPEDVRPEASLFAPALAGYFCSRAPLPIIPDAPRVRDVQLAQARTALPWAARWLGLPEPEGNPDRTD